MSPANMMDAPSHAPVTSERSQTRRIPASGNAGLAASGLIQAALGVEFFLSGLNKFADPNYVHNSAGEASARFPACRCEGGGRAVQDYYATRDSEFR